MQKNAKNAKKYKSYTENQKSNIHKSDKLTCKNQTFDKYISHLNQRMVLS